MSKQVSRQASEDNGGQWRTIEYIEVIYIHKATRGRTKVTTLRRGRKNEKNYTGK